MSLKQNQDRKHRTYVYVLTVTETLEAWEDSVNIGISPLICAPVSTGSAVCLFIYAEACKLLGDWWECSENR